MGRSKAVRLRRRAAGDEGIFLAPMVDVVFLLLFFFLVTGTIERRSSVLPIHLPTASALVAAEAPKELRVEVDPLGRIFVEGRETTLSALGARLREAPPKVLVLAADRSAMHGVVVGVLAEAKAAGVSDFAFEVVATAREAP